MNGLLLRKITISGVESGLEATALIQARGDMHVRTK